MFWPFKKKNPTVTSKTRKYTPEVIAAKNYLDMTHPTLLPRNSSMASIVGHPPFNYVGSLCLMMAILTFRLFLKAKIWIKLYKKETLLSPLFLQ